MRKIELAALPGDGVGIEVVESGKDVLHTLADAHGGVEFSFTTFPWSCDYYVEHGEMMPKDAMNTLKQFEALFLNMVMKSMRDATPQNGPFDNEQTKMFTSMLDQQLSQSLAQRGVGLADVLTRQLSASLPKKLPDAQDLEGNPLPGEEGLPMGIPLVKDMSDADRAKFIQSFASQQAAESTDQDGRNKQRRNSNKPAHVEAFQNRLQADAEAASRVTGIPVHRLTMKEISSSPNTGRYDWRRFSHSSCFLRISPCSSRSLSRSDAARSKF